MYQVNDFLVYGKDVCQVISVLDDEYVLSPLKDNSLKIKTSIHSDKIRGLISKEGILELLQRIPGIGIITSDDKFIEAEYKRCLQSGTYEDLIRIIKTTYLKNKERIDNKRKRTDRDVNYFNKAEEILYQEFSVVLGLSFDETRDYIVQEVAKYEKSNA